MQFGTTQYLRNTCSRCSSPKVQVGFASFSVKQGEGYSFFFHPSKVKVVLLLHLYFAKGYGFIPSAFCLYLVCSAYLVSHIDHHLSNFLPSAWVWCHIHHQAYPIYSAICYASDMIKARILLARLPTFTVVISTKTRAVPHPLEQCDFYTIFRRSRTAKPNKWSWA